MLKGKMTGNRFKKSMPGISISLKKKKSLIFLGNIFKAMLPAFFLFSSCDLSETEDIGFDQVNFIYIGDQPFQFVSAKLTLIGPVEVDKPNSHYWANLQLSTDIEFREPYIPNSSVISIGIHTVYDGTPLPKFPLKDGEYKVFPPAGISDQEILSSLEGKNFSLGPSIGLNYLSSQLTFNNFRDAESGIVDLSFDFSKNRVRVAHNWVTKEGTKIVGTSLVPIDISGFIP
jgi:hypothetical protein